MILTFAAQPKHPTKRKDSFHELTQWIGLRDNLQETVAFPMKHRALRFFPLNQSSDSSLENGLWYAQGPVGFICNPVPELSRKVAIT